MRQKRIFWFWLPLFASWLLMTMEGPFVSAVINRLPDEVIMLAAQGIVVSLAVMIESPIINLLATSTALVHDRPSYELMRRFTFHWMIALTIVSVLIAFTPLFDLVVLTWLSTPPEIAQWVQPGLQIMIFWSAAIAWRRFLQGVMIHYDQPRKVAWGTALRLASSAATAALMAFATDLPGVMIGASALMTGVIAEAIFATIAVRPILQNELDPDGPVQEGPALSYRELFWFHLPLAGTSVLILLSQPLVTSSLARLENPTISLAAWPIIFQILLVSRAAAFAWPEAVIALSDGSRTFIPIRSFSYKMVLSLTAFMFVFVFTPLSSFYLFVVQDMTLPVGELARSTIIFFALFPGMAVITSWLRGLLIKQRVTKEINLGMAINLAATGAVLVVGVQNRWPGLPTAALALNLAALLEMLYLAIRTRRHLAFDVPFLGLRGQALKLSRGPS